MFLCFPALRARKEGGWFSFSSNFVVAISILLRGKVKSSYESYLFSLLH